MHQNGPWGPRSSRQRRRRARLGVRADTKDRYSLENFEPRDLLVLALQVYKSRRRRIKGDCTTMAAYAKGTTVAMLMLCLGRICLGIRSGRHAGTDGSHIERIGRGISDNAKGRDRRHQLHQDREHHDWNEYFQPPSHHCSIEETLVTLAGEYVSAFLWCTGGASLRPYRFT